MDVPVLFADNLFQFLSDDRLFAVGAECYAVYCAKTGATPIYQVQNPELRNHAPMKGHILGTDYLGRDVLLRAVFATRTAVKVGIVASLISALFGVVLGLFGVVTSRALREKRRVAIVASFVMGMLLTPPDPMSQILMAVPLCLLYEISVWAVYLKERAR